MHYFDDKIHCVWLSDGEMKVLFECKEFDAPYHIGLVHLEFISNEELVKEYLDKVDHILHIQRIVEMEPTEGLQY